MSTRAAMRLSLRIAALALPALALTRGASAQVVSERSPLEASSVDTAVDFRGADAGLRTGAVRWLPSAGLSLIHDTNVFATPAPRTEEALALAEARLGLVDDAGPVRVDGGAFARIRRFQDSDDQNTTEYGGSLGVGTESSNRNALSAHLLAQRRFESHVDVETPDTREVSLYDQCQADLGFRHSFNRVSMGASFNGQRLAYREASQRFRDLSSYRGELQFGYGLRGGLSLTATGYYGEDRFRYANPLVVSARTRGMLLGVRSDVTDLIQLELGAGEFRREFAQNAGSDSGLSLRGAVNWWPTRLTTVRAELLREDASTQIPGAVGKVRTDASLQVGYQYTRRLNLFMRLHGVEDDFDRIGRTDRTYVGALGAERLLGSRWVLGAEYDFATRQSTVPAANFVRHVPSVSLRGEF